MRDAQGHSNIFVAEPVPLTAAKSIWNLFRAQRQMFSMPREYLHKGLVVSHHSWGRGIASAMESETRCLHEMVVAEPALEDHEN